MAVIAFSFGVLVVVGYYKIEDSAISTASNSNSKELNISPK